jgi:hypothetical protein
MDPDPYLLTNGSGSQHPGGPKTYGSDESATMLGT